MVVDWTGRKRKESKEIEALIPQMKKCVKSCFGLSSVHGGEGRRVGEVDEYKMPTRYPNRNAHFCHSRKRTGNTE